jgi:hypothetical protein
MKTLEEILKDVEKLDLGVAKTQRVRAYVKAYYQLGIPKRLQLKRIAKMSKKQIVQARLALK